MLLSISRAIAIALPSRHVNEMRHGFLFAFGLYCFVPPVSDLTLLLGSGSPYYRPAPAYCIPGFMGSWGFAEIFALILDLIEVLIPSIICFICFVICTVKLIVSSSPTETAQERKRKAAVTVTMFTGLFLLCNLPLFINTVLQTVVFVHYDYPYPFFESNFMFWYSWPVSYVLFSALNASFNPVLYFCRIPGLKGGSRIKHERQ